MLKNPVYAALFKSLSDDLFVTTDSGLIAILVSVIIINNLKHSK